MALHPDHLRTFLAVIAHGSFSRAATALHMSQSTVSFQVKALEEAVGARLFDRATREVRLTDGGRTLRPFARRILELGGEAREKLREVEGGETGQIRVAASSIPADHLLPLALAHHRKRWPLHSVTVEVSDSRGALRMLTDGDVDLAVVGTPPRDRRVQARAFAGDEVVLVAAAGSPFAPGGRLTRAALGKVPLLSREPGSGTAGAVGHVVPDADLPAIQIGSSAGLTRCVELGLGLAFLSRWAVEDGVARGTLRVVAAPGLPVRRRFWLARLRGVTLGKPARLLAQSIEETDYSHRFHR